MKIRAFAWFGSSPLEQVQPEGAIRRVGIVIAVTVMLFASPALAEGGPYKTYSKSAGDGWLRSGESPTTCSGPIR
jgi:hypothetical protein